MLFWYFYLLYHKKKPFGIGIQKNLQYIYKINFDNFTLELTSAMCYNELYISWKEQTYAKEVVKKATTRVNEKYKANNLPTKTEEELRLEISGYAASTKNGTIMYAETFAEALVDYLSNGENASDLSIEIYKIVQEDLKSM